MQNFLNGLLIVALPITTVLLAVNKIDAAAITLVVISLTVSLIFTNLNKISRFKSSILEFEMRQATEKALAAVEDLKKLALALTDPFVSLYTLEGDGVIGRRQIPYQTKLEKVKEIKNVLTQLGASESQIETSCGALNRVLLNLHIYEPLRILKLYNEQKKPEIFKDINEWTVAPDWSVDQIREFIKMNDLECPKAVEDAILDYEHYLKTGDIRRPTKRQFS